MNIEHISISRQSLFKECHAKYKYKYHLKIPVPGPEPEYFLYGKVVHKIIELYTLGRSKIPLKDIVAKVFKEGLDDKPINLSAEYKKYLPGDLSSFMRLINKIGTEGECELPFTVDLQAPNKKLLTGLIDRIYQTKNEDIVIIDYKTSKDNFYRKNKKNVIFDPQLQTYAYIMMKEFGVPANKIRCGLFYLRDNPGVQIVGAQFTKETLEEVPKRLLETYDSIFDMDVDKVVGNVGMHCNRCEFANICSFWSLAKTMNLYQKKN